MPFGSERPKRSESKDDGHQEDRDINAAQVMLAWARGQELVSLDVEPPSFYRLRKHEATRSVEASETSSSSIAARRGSPIDGVRLDQARKSRRKPKHKLGLGYRDIVSDNLSPRHHGCRGLKTDKRFLPERETHKGNAREIK